MTTKPSPNATKMLKSIQEHFEQAFKSNFYSPLFRREYMHLFKIDHATDFSLSGNNDAYVFGLGIIDCWNFDKNIKKIESHINKKIDEELKQIRFFENLIPLVEKEKAEGIIEDAFTNAFNKTLQKTNKWKEAKEIRPVLLPLFLSQLNGNVHYDYQLVKNELTKSIARKTESDLNNLLYKKLCD